MTDYIGKMKFSSLFLIAFGSVIRPDALGGPQIDEKKVWLSDPSLNCPKLFCKFQFSDVFTVSTCPMCLACVLQVNTVKELEEPLK